MNAHSTNTLCRTIQRLAGVEAADTARDQTEAVANSIGCPNWTSPEGCDGHNRDPRYECHCAVAAKAVVLIERQAQTVAA